MTHLEMRGTQRREGERRFLSFAVNLAHGVSSHFGFWILDFGF
jgi:hypothetical protein